MTTNDLIIDYMDTFHRHPRDRLIELINEYGFKGIRSFESGGLCTEFDRWPEFSLMQLAIAWNVSDE